MFDLTRTVEMVDEIMHLNRKLVEESLPNILIGPSRWGTCDRHPGIPVYQNGRSAAGSCEWQESLREGD